MASLYDTRPLVAHYKKAISDMDLKNNRLTENMITLDNIKLVFYVELLLIASAAVTFVIEVFSTEIFLMMLTTKVINLRD